MSCQNEVKHLQTVVQSTYESLPPMPNYFENIPRPNILILGNEEQWVKLQKEGTFSRITNLFSPQDGVFVKKEGDKENDLRLRYAQRTKTPFNLSELDNFLDACKTRKECIESYNKRFLEAFNKSYASLMDENYDYHADKDDNGVVCIKYSLKKELQKSEFLKQEFAIYPNNMTDTAMVSIVSHGKVGRVLRKLEDKFENVSLHYDTESQSLITFRKMDDGSSNETLAVLSVDDTLHERLSKMNKSLSKINSSRDESLTLCVNCQSVCNKDFPKGNGYVCGTC